MLCIKKCINSSISKKIDVNFLTLQKESVFSRRRSLILKKFIKIILKNIMANISTYNNYKEKFL